jgi:hypothetical protein
VGTRVAEERFAFDVIYTEAMVTDAARVFVFRRFMKDQKRLWILSGLMLLFAGYLAGKGQSPWLVALAASGALMAPVLLGLAWYVHLSRTREGFRRLGVPRASVVLDQGGMKVTSDLGSGEIPYASLTAVWERPRYWMLFTARDQFNVLPREGVPEEAQRFLRERTARVLARA